MVSFDVCGGSSNKSNNITKIMLDILCNGNGGLSVYHLNAQSVYPKIDEFYDIFNNSLIDIILVSETWLKVQIVNAQISLSNFKVLRNDRVMHGGDVIVFVRNDLKARTVAASSSNSHIEFIFIELVLNSVKCLIGCIYRPPWADGLGVSELESFHNSHSHKYNYICIGGDFNINLLYSSSSVQSFCNFISSYGLQFINNTISTHFSGNSATLLDLFLVTDINIATWYDQLPFPGFSKHDLIALNLDLPRSKQHNISFSYPDYKQINLELLLSHASLLNWNNVYYCKSLEQKVNIFTYLVNSLFHDFFSYKNV